MGQSFASLAEGLVLRKYDDWLIFDQRLKTLIREGQAKRITALKRIHASYEEWYLEQSSGEIYVYVPPDEKIVATWEPVDVFAEKRKDEPRPAAMPAERRNSIQTQLFKQFLKVLVDHGAAEIIKCPSFSTAEGVTETWYKVQHPQSSVVYRLVENADGSSLWEPSDCKDIAIQ
jgi:hypothetical protein